MKRRTGADHYLHAWQVRSARVGQLGLELPRFAGFHALHLFVELLDVAVAETEHRTQPQSFFLGPLDQRFVAVFEGELANDVVARLGRSGIGTNWPRFVSNSSSRLSTSASLKSWIGRSMLRPFQIRQIKLGTNLDIELELQRSFVGQLDRRRIELRLADGHEILGLGNLRHAVQQQRAAHLIGDVLSKSVFHQLARSADPGGSPARWLTPSNR